MPERPLVAESQSNGIIKRTVGLAAGQARTLKAALEDRIGAKVPPYERKLCWLVEFAANLMSRLRHRQRLKDADTQTAWTKGNTAILDLGADFVLALPNQQEE